jgi:hypothetical protein
MATTSQDLRLFLKRVINLATSDFTAIFGEDSGRYQQGKLFREFRGDAAQWILYLDDANLQKLTDYVSQE